jgi:lipoyl(octanoyl) transferase
MSDRVLLKKSSELVEYEDAVAFMEKQVDLILHEGALECIWLLEHPPMITAGTSANVSELLNAKALPVYEAARGGKHTYHGPGQRTIYVMMDLRQSKDIRQFVISLEAWIVNTLKQFDIDAETDVKNVGIWLPHSVNGVRSKVGAIGLRVRKWVTYHGVAINIAPDLNHFKYFVPCGISDLGVTSLQNEGKLIPLEMFDEALIQVFCKQFNKKIVFSA